MLAIGFVSEEPFALWAYNASHDQLLLRSPARDANGENTDILFKGVFFVNLMPRFRGVRIRAATGAEAEVSRMGHGHQAKEKALYALETDKGTFLVGAVHASVSRNRLGPREYGMDFC